jgi:dipeptidase E
VFRLIPYILGLTEKDDPAVCCVATAMGDAPESFLRFYETFGAHRCRPSHIRLFGIPTPGWREHLLAQDVIFVGGGNTANMLAVWRVHDVEPVLREAWEQGVVLSGGSAGAICWFERGVSDSFREELDGIECLGWLAGSCCPHYDSEPARRPAVERLLREGFPPGVAIDDHAAVRFSGTAVAEVVSAVAGAGAYRFEPGDTGVRETPLSVRDVSGA